MDNLKNIWGPSAYTATDPRPWHNLPAAIGAAPPHTAMHGLSFAYALSITENMADVPALQKAAYDAWQEGLVGDDFAQAVTTKAAAFVEVPLPLDVAAAAAALAAAVSHFSGGAFLAAGLQFIAEGDAEIEAQMGITRTPEAGFGVAKKLLSLWAGAWQGGEQENSSISALIFSLCQLTPPEMAELDDTHAQELQHLHTLHIARLFVGNAHVVDDVLHAATAKAVVALDSIVNQKAVTLLGTLDVPNPLGLGLSGVWQQLALEGVYPWPHPRVAAGEALEPSQTQALEQAYGQHNLADVLAATFQSPTFENLPTAKAFLKTPPLSRQSVLERLITQTFTA